MASASPPISRFPLYLSIAFLAASIIGLELLQTRILSALYFNRVVYFTVTIALMGFGIAGVVLSLLTRNGRPSSRWTVLFTGLFGATMLICLGITSRIPLWIAEAPQYSYLPYLTYLLLITPFFCGGMAIGLLLLAHGPIAQRLYAADLAGSAIAAILVLLLLLPLGASALVWICALLACTSMLLQMGMRPPLRWQPFAFVLAVALAALLIGNRLIGYWPGPSKDLGRYAAAARAQGKPLPLEISEWTPIARIDIIATGARRLLTQDGAAFSGILPGSEVDLALRTRQMNTIGQFSLPLIYQMNPHNNDALIIGTGGGVDIVRAKAFGAQHIEAVEVNSVTFDAMRHRYARFARWPLWPEVKAYRSEGRHFISQQHERYDKITMSGIDTYAASNAGAYVLTENYLYTVEAMQDYMHAMKPDGIMVILRWLLFDPVARESIRLASNFIEAAKREGIEHPEQCIFVTGENSDYPDRMWGSTFIKKTPFTQEEIRTALANLKDKAAAVLYLPKIFPPEEQRRLEIQLSRVRQGDLATARRNYQRLINAPSDEQREAFFNDHPFNLRPTYDNSPFFFQDIKFTATGNQNPKIICYVCQLYRWLGITVVVSLVGMILPLTVFNAEGLASRGAPWLILYFTSLGLGFMMIELGLMQRLSLYLGDPMYSLTVILGGLLFFAGLGSYAGNALRIPVEALMKRGTLMTALALLAWLLLAPPLMSATLSLPFWCRTSIVLVTLLPLGMAMGMPFSAGLAYVERITPRFIPWAWGINGLTSVMASVLSIILAMNIGFTNVLLCGAAIYITGSAAAARYIRRTQAS